MCIAALALHVTDEFPFVFVHNREESWDRETSHVELQTSADRPGGIPVHGTICARDQEYGGTWMGINALTKSFAALTNVRDRMVRPSGEPSRGHMITSLISTHAERSTDFNKYSAFNVFYSPSIIPRDLNGHPSTIKVYYSSSVPSDVTCSWKNAPPAQIAPGSVTCTSNSSSGLQEKSWPKEVWLKNEVQNLMQSVHHEKEAYCGEAGFERLLSQLTTVISESVIFPVATSFPTNFFDFSPYPVHKEHICQCGPFVRAQEKGWDGYGTRSQSVVVVSRSCMKVFYCYRNTQDQEHVDYKATTHWTVFPVPWHVEDALPHINPLIKPYLLTTTKYLPPAKY